jgi:hypothetical protein
LEGGVPGRVSAAMSRAARAWSRRWWAVAVAASATFGLGPAASDLAYSLTENETVAGHAWLASVVAHFAVFWVLVAGAAFRAWLTGRPD